MFYVPHKTHAHTTANSVTLHTRISKIIVVLVVISPVTDGWWPVYLVKIKNSPGDPFTAE